MRCGSTHIGLQARNISITVRTILLGLSYLATFIFAANGLGLAGGAMGEAPGRCISRSC